MCWDILGFTSQVAMVWTHLEDLGWLVALGASPISGVDNKVIVKTCSGLYIYIYIYA